MITIAVSSLACSKDDDGPKEKGPSAKLSVENNDELVITDGGSLAGSVENSVTVNDEGTIGDGSKVTVRLDLQHTYASDLVVQLIAPSGESCTLLKRPLSGTANASSNFVAGNIISFNALATEAFFAVGDVVPTGTYLPTGGTTTNPESVTITDLGPFFTGKSIKGSWKLKVGDYASEDAGKVNNWKLEFDTGALQ